MYATDFEFDGVLLSDYKCMICSFDSASGVQTINAGSVITFNKSTRNFGRQYSLIGVQYDECITSTFDICKDPDLNEHLYFTSEECRDIMRWLNRTSFIKFKLITNNYQDCEFYYNSSFNIEKIKVADKVCGFRLKMETDKPYAYGYDEIVSFSALADTEYYITDISDEIGDIYPSIEITPSSSGTLNIVNSTLDETSTITGCTSGEKIVIDGDKLQISTSSNRNIYDYFNFTFPRLVNKLDNRVNKLKFSLPCSVVITYKPIIKETI